MSLQLHVEKRSEGVSDAFTGFNIRVLTSDGQDITEELAITKIEVTIEAPEVVTGIFHCHLGRIDMDLLASLRLVEDDGGLEVGGDLWRRDEVTNNG